MDAHNRLARRARAHPPVPTYAGDRLPWRMLDKERVDVVLVTTVDATHDEYIVAALTPAGTWSPRSR